MDIHSPIHTDILTYILTMTPLTHMLHACLSCFYTSYLLLFISVLIPLTSFYLHVLYHHILTAAFSSFFLSSSYTFFYPLLRKLPWLSRQSDRLLTDRSLVRSQAEAPFLLFSLPTLYEIYIATFPNLTKSTPPVGLEPTTARLRAARSTD